MLLGLMTVAALSLPSLSADPIGDPPPGSQHMDLQEIPPPLDGCPPATATVTSLQHRSDGAHLMVVNLTSAPVQDFLILDLTVKGTRRVFWTSVALDPGAYGKYMIKYLGPIQAPGVGLCANKPGGIVDSQGPVAEVYQLPVE